MSEKIFTQRHKFWHCTFQGGPAENSRESQQKLLEDKRKDPQLEISNNLWTKIIKSGWVDYVRTYAHRPIFWFWHYMNEYCGWNVVAEWNIIFFIGEKTKTKYNGVFRLHFGSTRIVWDNKMEVKINCTFFNKLKLLSHDFV